jgi:poly(3-hydroxybutyrate) depolymerase
MFLLSAALAAVVVGCRVPTARAAANTTLESIVVDGMTRTYRLHMPPDSDGPLPLVFNFHGYGGVQYLPVWAVGHTNRDYDASQTILTFFSRYVRLR